MISLKGVTLAIGNQTIYNKISLNISEGEILAIMGPSGCGKTSLLRTIAGLINCTSGSIQIFGMTPEEYLKKRQVAIVFQRYSNLGWLNALDNVSAAFARAEPKSERRKKAGERLKEVGLERAGHKYMRQLSGGMQQRVALARAMAQGSDVLLLDEPFAALDSITRDEVGNVLKALLKTHKRTVVLVSHSIEDALHLANSVIVMGGRPSEIRGTVAIPDLTKLLPEQRMIQEQTIREDIHSLLKACSEITI